MATKQTLEIDYTKYDFHNSDESYEYKFQKGLSRETVEQISKIKNEPEWMLQFRLRSYDHFLKRPLPMWGGDLTTLKFEDMKNTFDKLGIPEAERKFLGGVGAPAYRGYR
jgi:Fe-S cluster assembly protein SufB